MSTIKIDENSRITLEVDNYTLEVRVKAGTRPDGTAPTSEYKWIIEGYYPDLVSLSTSWVKNAPARKFRGEMHTLADVVKCIKDAEAHITKLITQ